MDHAAVTATTPSILDGLNPEQRSAVEATQGPVLVLAGAGTGKTRVLTTRIAHILTQKLAWPDQILAVTFTNKAAREMGERVGHLLTQTRAGVGSSGMRWLGTFHSIGAKIIRTHAEKLGLTSSFTILDTDDQLRLLKALLQERKIDDKATPPRLFAAIIQQWKDQGLTPDRVTSAKDIAAAAGEALPIYRAYQSRLLQLNACDFGDLILHMLTLFTQHPSVHQEYARRFHYILVDEYQDTNVAQYLWLRLLAMGHHNICCVGDDDQSIYSWRGAEVGNILRFEQDFPQATTVRLECNYRSTPHILAAASAVIAHNQGRFGKTLWTEVKEGEKIRLKSIWDEAEEARFIAEEIETLRHRNHSLQQMAILVRAGFQTRAFEERFLTMGIPYRVVGGLRFYERAEVRDAVAYLRLVAVQTDDLAFERVVNLPKRGIGQATLGNIHNHARAQQCSLFAATQSLLATGTLKGKVGTTLATFTRQVLAWKEASASRTVSALMDQILNESGYRAMWQQEKTPEAQGRLENLKELSRALGEFETIEAFLEHVSLVMEAASDGQSTDMVSIMTLHAAKGLEFDIVFLPGWEEGVFPHSRALDESGQKGLEEERRLAYVGMTRARKLLYITHAANRRIYNQWQSSIASRFIAEIPAADVEKLPGGLYSGRSSRDWAAEAASIMSPPPSSTTASGYQQGMRIFHEKFGYGRITSVQDQHLDITFEKAGQKKLLADFVRPAHPATSENR